VQSIYHPLFAYVELAGHIRKKRVMVTIQNRRQDIRIVVTEGALSFASSLMLVYPILLWDIGMNAPNIMECGAALATRAS